MTSRTADDRPGTLIALASLPNLRDIGGYRAGPDGRVKSGVLYRSVALNNLTPPDATELEKRRVRTVYDFRTEPERTAAPDRLPAGASYVVCDVLAGAADAAPAQLSDIIDDPARVTRELGGGRAVEQFHDAYRRMVSSDTARRAYRSFFTDLLEATESQSSLFHCTTGKDRTGWAAAATLLLLGVDEHDVFDDYEATNRDLLPTLTEQFTKFAASGGDLAILRAVLGVEAGYLRTALEEMTRQFGSITGYFHDGLDLDEAAQDQLRDRLVEPERSR